MIFQSQILNFADTIMVSLILKLVILAVLISILIYVNFKMLSHYISHRKSRTRSFKKKATVHIIRRIPKTRTVRKKKV